MKSNASGRNATFGIGSALLGGMAGFAAGLLFAPEEGQRTRRRVVYQLENLALRVVLFVQRVLSDDAGSEARRTGDALVADAQARAQRIRDDIDALLEEMRQQGASAEASGE